MAEADEAGDPDQEIETEDEDGEDENPRGELHRIGAAEGRHQKRGDQQRGQNGEDERSRPGQHVRPARTSRPD